MFQYAVAALPVAVDGRSVPLLAARRGNTAIVQRCRYRSRRHPGDIHVEDPAHDGSLLLDDLQFAFPTSDRSVQPAIEEWKRMKVLGVGISGLIAFAGLTVGGIMAYVSDGAVAWFRHWLKIN
ncbi:DUF1515 domain-containing protein [Rhizobium sp. NZLR1]|uniref:DUF1515 domain-containing protein n=1 Tax=Rhizobium sp. NZLR1 TaxID=2731096 RepID=UPI00287F8D0C|nr:DUF1515 domain-containing protein [Rhizobium sp. NZLR1]